MTDYKRNFADKLRALRRAKGMTQRELSERVGFSEKTVSKWECGVGMPDIDTLFRIAELFGTGLVSLFEGGERFCLGIDGGGTKTALCLADCTGQPIRTLTLGSSNPMDLGFDAATSVLREGIREVLGGIPPSAVSCFAGLSGGGNTHMRARMAKFFRSFGFLAFDNDSDNRNTVAAALGDADGVAVILGTGICAYTQKSGEHIRTGGWGYLFDGGGSAYDLGRDALRAYFLAQDGCGMASALTEEVARLHGGSADDVLRDAYAGGKRAVAAFAPAVFRAIERGDGAAVRLLEDNLAHAADIIRTAARPLEGCVSVCLVGGLTAQPLVENTLRRMLEDAERYAISVVDTPPVLGAVSLACKLLLAKENHL